MHIDGVDEIDNKILGIIKNNARLSYSEIAKEVGISRVSVKTRMDALEKRGVIQGYQTVINTKAAETGFRFQLMITAKDGEFENLLNALAYEFPIKRLHIVSGENQMLAVGYTSDSRNFSVYVSRFSRMFDKYIKKFTYTLILGTVMDLDGGIDYEIRHKESEHLEGRQPSSEANDEE